MYLQVYLETFYIENAKSVNPTAHYLIWDATMCFFPPLNGTEQFSNTCESMNQDFLPTRWPVLKKQRRMQTNLRSAKGGRTHNTIRNVAQRPSTGRDAERGAMHHGKGCWARSDASREGMLREERCITGKDAERGARAAAAAGVEGSSDERERTEATSWKTEVSAGFKWRLRLSWVWKASPAPGNKAWFGEVSGPA